jgi:oxygen-independent coproporphyrinogen-3 oxidase
VLETVDLAVRLAPHRIALFGYAHVPWMKSHMKMIDESVLPGAEERWRQFEAASARLAELGYIKVGLDHFARPDDDMAAALKEGRMHRNFQGYTTDAAEVLLGFGASAIGQLPQGYAQNLSPLKAWRAAVENGVLPTARGIALSEEDRRRAIIIERLMCNLHVDLEEVGGAGAYRAEVEKLAPLVKDGLVTIDGSRIAISEDGRPFARLAAAAFDAYLDQNQAVGEGRKEGDQKEARHSRAV